MLACFLCDVFVIYCVMLYGEFMCFVLVCMLVLIVFACFVCTVWRDVRWSVFCYVLFYCLCLCVLLLFNVFVRCGCDLLCDVVRFVAVFVGACVFGCGSVV